MNKKKKPAVNMPMYIAFVLFCVTIISIHLTKGLYAKYFTMDESEDSARVIYFGDLKLTETGNFYESGKMMIIPGVDLQKKAVVDFDGSESATYVFVKIKLSPCWTSSDNKEFSIKDGEKILLQWSVDSGWTFLEADSGTYVYYKELSPNSPISAADIIANDGKILVSEYITKNELSSMTDVSIELSAAVVQAGGFESPAKAWESLEGNGV